jgi:hypothetical protein
LTGKKRSTETFPFSNLQAGKRGFIVLKTDDLKHSSGMVHKTPLQTLPHLGCLPWQQGRIVSTFPHRDAFTRTNWKHKAFYAPEPICNAKLQGFLTVFLTSNVRLVTKNMATTPNPLQMEVHPKGKRQLQNCPARDVVCSD